jgi:hydrogenase maturation factor HypE
MKSLLKMDANERLSATQALQHPYFDGLREGDLEKVDLMRNNALSRIDSAHSNKNSRMRNTNVARKENVGSNSPQDMKKMSKKVKEANEVAGIHHNYQTS